MDNKANGNGTQPNKTEISIAECILPERPSSKKSRRALVKATGMDPKGMETCHLCPNDSTHGGCINPTHLYWGTPSQNRSDYWNSDRAHETRRKTSESMKGNKNCLGRLQLEETRRKISESLKVSMKGLTKSEEHKRKISESMKRRRSKGE